jgi:hypothetical protein
MLLKENCFKQFFILQKNNVFVSLESWAIKYQVIFGEKVYEIIWL